MDENKKPEEKMPQKRGIKIALHVALWCVTLTVAGIISTQSIEKWNTAKLVDDAGKVPAISYASDSDSSIVFEKSEESVDSAVHQPDGSESTEQRPVETAVYVSKSGSKYHFSGCQYVNDNMDIIDINDALANGYEACKRCGNR